MMVTNVPSQGSLPNWSPTPTSPATSCNQFKAAAAADGGFWFADGAGGCLLEIDASTETPSLFLGPESYVSTIAAGSGEIWTFGSGGRGRRVWAQMGNWRDGHWVVDEPDRWGLPDIWINAAD